ncbi:MAG: D-alanyl-D-alanine carboxypeptidase/D-alanyl-D-alanine-endopeptidase [Bryobacteraceae bacterium]
MRCPWYAPLLLVALLPCSGADLAQRMDTLLEANANGKLGIAGISVIDLSTGQPVFQKNAQQLLLPASNLKILTAAMAMEKLGADYRFHTRVLLDAAGNLVLVGSGDPSFSSRVYPYANGKHTPATLQAMEELTDQIAAAGVRRIDGDVIGDDRLYPWEPFPSSWTADDTLYGFGAPVSALSFNDNVVEVIVTAGAKEGDAARMAPSFAQITAHNRVRTGPAGGRASIVQHKAGENEWTISGTIPANGVGSVLELPVADPAEFAASALFDALTRRGIAVRGRPVARHRVTGETYAAPEGHEVAVRVSPPLEQILGAMLKVSQNLHAELLLRESARATQREASSDAGAKALTAFLQDRGGDPGEWRTEDGSGLARNDLATPQLLARTLHQQYQAHGDSWIKLFPAGGAEGTLDHRLCCVSDGRGVWAKTGTLNRAVALSGYAKGSQGSMAFSVIVNNFSASTGEVQQWVDKIAVALLE